MKWTCYLPHGDVMPWCRFYQNKMTESEMEEASGTQDDCFRYAIPKIFLHHWWPSVPAIYDGVEWLPSTVYLVL